MVWSNDQTTETKIDTISNSIHVTPTNQVTIKNFFWDSIFFGKICDYF
jgi:hypothetical protein